MKKSGFYVLLACAMIVVMSPSPLYAEATDNGQNAAPAPRFFQWAWELPENTFSAYPITDYSYWTPVNSPIGGGFRFLSLRDTENTDEWHVGGYFFFRPAVLRLGGSFLSLGGYVTFDGFYGEGQDDLPLGDVNNANAVLNARGIPITAGISLLWSLPESGLQMNLEIGHYWSSTKLYSRDIRLPVPAELDGLGLEPIPGSVVSEQEETGLDIFCAFSWVTERNYLSGISLTILSNYRTGPAEVTTKLRYPAVIDIPVPPFVVPLGTQEVPDKPVQSSYIISLVYLKAIAIPFDMHVPLLQSDKQKDFVTIEPAVGVGYARVDHGHILGAGVRVSVADVLGVSYFHTWEQKNDRADNDILMFELGFQFGHRLGPRN